MIIQKREGLVGGGGVKRGQGKEQSLKWILNEIRHDFERYSATYESAVLFREVISDFIVFFKMKTKP